MIRGGLIVRRVVVWGIIALCLGLIAAEAWVIFQQKTQNQNLMKMQIARHWEQVGLSEKKLFLFLNQENCVQESRTKLACINAISQMAQKLNLKLMTSAQFSPVDKFDNLLFQTEKMDLNRWQNTEVYLNFPHLAKKLIEAYPLHLRSQLIASGINAYLAIAKDPHTYIMPETYYRNIVMNHQPTQPGFGISIGRAKVGSREYAAIKKLEPWSDALAKGLKLKDEVLEVQGIPLRSMTAGRLTDVMRSALQSQLLIKIKRGSTVIETVIRPQEINEKSVTFKVYGQLERLGVIRISKFARQTCEMVKDSIYELKKDLVRGVLLDLRDNPGGSIEEAGCVIGLFVGPKKLAYQVQFFDNSQSPEKYITSQEQHYKGRLAVLINHVSASASELVAGSLQFYKRAAVLGQRSYGKGSFQEGREWEHDSKVVIFETKGFYYLPSKITPQLVGISPDFPMVADESVQIREQDQYLFPLANPNPLTSELRPMALAEDNGKCESIEKESGSSDLDPSLNQSLEYLRCQKTQYASSSNPSI